MNMNAQLVGVNSAIATLGADSADAQSGSIGLGFAIPVDQAKRIADELISTGKASHASLGVQVTNDKDTPGAKIVEVVAGGAAANAGVPKGVVVTKVDDRPINSADALVAAVRSKAPGATVALTFRIPRAVAAQCKSPSARRSSDEGRRAVFKARIYGGTHGTACGVGGWPGTCRRR